MHKYKHLGTPLGHHTKLLVTEVPNS